MAPDGVERQVQVINGQIPGPTIEGNWGDTFVINVYNQVQNNGSSIHFHGVRQLNTNPQDGVTSITQCPIAPGQSQTYTWKATQYGSSWYHSHYGLQSWDGVAGAIVIHGPATANYQHDLGPLLLSDWDHQTADALYPTAQLAQAPPTLANGLINGTNTYGSLGKRWSTSLVSGQTYLLRVVNTAIDSTFIFSIDSHNFTVIAADFVPIQPFTTNLLSIGIAQRYDIIITANQASVAKNFWLRAVPDTYCSSNANGDNIRGIIHYGSGAAATPSTTAQPNYDVSTNCYGEPMASIVPFLAKTVSPSLSVNVETMDYIPNPDGLQRWYLDGSTFSSPWNNPTSLQIVNGATSFNASANVVAKPAADIWNYLVIETAEPFAHPIHLHGHDYYVLAKGSGTYAAELPVPNLANPPRRDTEMLPGNGYLLLGFLSDNPGVWLLHCHIGWHLEEGFSMQVVEQQGEIAAMYGEAALQGQCDTWDAYVEEDHVSQLGLYDDGV